MFIFQSTGYKIDNSINTLEDMFHVHEAEQNSMLALRTTEDLLIFDDFYDELSNTMVEENSMNIIFFGPSRHFLRIDAESVLHILSNTKKNLIPVSKILLAWDIVTDGKTAAFLQSREYIAFGSLLNLIPEDDLYHVNFGDPTVLKFFSEFVVNLDRRKYGILVSSYSRYFGTEWHKNGSFINDMGFILCGFSEESLKKISPKVFKEITVDTFNKLEKCSNRQLRILYRIATHREAFGRPYIWSSHEVGRLGMLFKLVSIKYISSLTLEAIAGITPEVMKAFSDYKLQYFTMQQVLRMNSKTRRIYILRMQLFRSLDVEGATREGVQIRARIFIIFLFYVMVTLRHYFGGAGGVI